MSFSEEITIKVLERDPDPSRLQLDQENLPEFRGWEFCAPTSLHVTFPPLA